MTMEKVKYSAVESGEVTPLEIELNPQDYLIFDLRKQVICTSCQTPLTWRKTDKSITLRCKCGCRIFYPERNAKRLSVWISQEEHDKRFNYD